MKKNHKGSCAMLQNLYNVPTEKELGSSNNFK